MKGPWIKVWRKAPSDEKLLAVIADHGDKAFRVWINLLCRAEDGIITDKRKIISALCGCSVKKLNPVLEDMHELGMIILGEDETICIPNWSEYQEGESTERSRAFRARCKEPDATPMQRECNVAQRVEGEGEGYREGEGDNIHVYGEHKNVRMTEKQRASLVADFGEAKAQACIEELSTAKAMKGYKYKRDDLAIRKWVIKAVEERPKQTPPIPSRPDAKSADEIAQYRRDAESKSMPTEAELAELEEMKRKAFATSPGAAKLLAAVMPRNST